MNISWNFVSDNFPLAQTVDCYEGDNSGLMDFELSRNLYKYYLIIHLSRQSNSLCNQWSQVFSKYLPMGISGFSPHHSMMTYIDISSMMTYIDIIQDLS